MNADEAMREFLALSWIHHAAAILTAAGRTVNATNVCAVRTFQQTHATDKKAAAFFDGLDVLDEYEIDELQFLVSLRVRD